MHPNRAFRFDSDADMLDWAVARGFAHIFSATSAGPLVAHAPITDAGSRSLRFHLARANPLAAHLDGARALLSISAADGYITPSWYLDGAGSVPTWNYVAVEIEGDVRCLNDTELTEQLDTLAAVHEPRVAPDAPWTRAKMDDARFVAMRRAIIGFELSVTAVRGTRKLSQNKSAADRARVIEGLERGGNAALADAMRTA